jgi:hypothetical protein
VSRRSIRRSCRGFRTRELDQKEITTDATGAEKEERLIEVERLCVLDVCKRR